MTEFGIEPAFVKIDYATVFGAHSHLICTRDWIVTSLTGTMGSYLGWDGIVRDAEDMIDELVGAMAPFHKPDTTITQATIFTKADEDSPSLPRAAKALTVVGTSGLTTHAKAIQKTMNFRSTGIQPAKLVFLDVPHSAGDFLKEFPAGWGADDLAIFGIFSLSANAWAARDNTQIASPVSITWNLNQQLRKQYKMA